MRRPVPESIKQKATGCADTQSGVQVARRQGETYVDSTQRFDQRFEAVEVDLDVVMYRQRQRLLHSLDQC